MSRDESQTVTSIHVRRACQGDQDSLSWLILRLSGLLLALAREICEPRLLGRCEVEDLVADTWLIALPKLDRIEARNGRFTPPLICYLSTCMRLRAKNLSRKSVPLPDGTLEGDPTLAVTSRSSLQKLIRDEVHELVMRLLALLDPLDAKIIIRRGIEGKTPEEIGTELGMIPNTVTVRYRRALAKLRARLPGTVFDEMVED